LLLHRCVERLQRDGQPLAVDALGDADVRMIGEHLADRQGLADLRLEIACTACGHRWDMPFDIASFFTVELRRYATQLLDEVHLLATAYGWEEPVILTMHPVRRRAYLERVLA
jgi:hypothetical protein